MEPGPGPTHRTRLTVRFGEVDSAGIVYYPRFLHYCHVAMEEYFAAVLGVDYARLLRRERLGFPAVRAEVDFASPLRYGDAVEVEAGVAAVGRTSVTWAYTVRRRGEDRPAATARVVTVALDLDAFEKRPVPGWFRDGVGGGDRRTPKSPAGDSL